MEKLSTNLTSKEVAIIILDTGVFEDYFIDYIKDINGKFKCRLKQPWARAISGYTFYPPLSQTPFESKPDAIESCLLHIRSMGGLGYIKFDSYNEESKKKTLKKKEILEPIVENIEINIIPEENIEIVKILEIPIENIEIN